MMQGLLDFICWIANHKLELTGLSGCRMTEVRCQFCGRCYVLHRDHPGMLVESDRELRDLMRGRYP